MVDKVIVERKGDEAISLSERMLEEYSVEVYYELYMGRIDCYRIALAIVSPG
jgi:hypothetical protein